ncbi:hypothetical protein [Mycobacterium helveticum]|jgi:hypothetical protein|uniref:Uncharacterized protein n=1 Tax=Mycobacterium helveticum TaxID=2592811 RepID=A0A557XWC1_9MYCO|nr:hypothetical protein [Mycobacterium helveticum]TVS86301.1 hypothetical protein FPZ46_11885 [Mycobacterium helveticum]TVS90337.1 hypothetical protein FPZ47_09850 [Mycobacterium helveticum]
MCRSSWRSSRWRVSASTGSANVSLLHTAGNDLPAAVNAPTDALIAASAPAYSFAPAVSARTNWSWKVAACALTA